MDTKADAKAADTLQALTVLMADMQDELKEWRPMIDRLRAQLAQDGRAQEKSHESEVITLEDMIDRLRARVVFWRKTALLFMSIASLFIVLQVAWR
jgi:hypothetical protein